MTGRLIPFRRPGGCENLNDDALVTACAKGDNTALEELFQRHGDRVHRILARLGTVDRRDLADVLLSTFMAVQRASRGFDRRSAVGTWIVGIALRVAQRHARGQARRPLAMAAPLVAGFESLPFSLRSVFALCELEGMRGADAARALRIPESTVWRRLHDARLRLRALVDAEARP